MFEYGGNGIGDKVLLGTQIGCVWSSVVTFRFVRLWIVDMVVGQLYSVTFALRSIIAVVSHHL